jgi:hypothetical protein
MRLPWINPLLDKMLEFDRLDGQFDKLERKFDVVMQHITRQN